MGSDHSDELAVRTPGIAHGVSVALLRPLAELLARIDLDAAHFLAVLGVDDGSAPDTYVSGERVDQLLDELAAQRGDPSFGLTLAKIAVVRPLGLFSHLLWLSGTVRDALIRAVRFYPMVSRRTTLSLHEDNAVATLRQQRIPAAARGAILTEFPFASLALRARAETAGQFALRAVRFVHPKPLVSDAAYREVFGAPVTFGAAFDELELATSELDRPLASADPITSAALEAQIAELAVTTGRSPFLDRVRRTAAANLAAHPSLVVFAKNLGISARTLRRHLEHEGTSLRALVDDVRRERADELLAAGTAIKEIAFSLGFSEPSAFSRAYKRWTGRTPKLGRGQSGQ
ncbi:MAG: AraC family transcriptional regulator ligand-binding domain-containing protein [Deltaproteobacteria bacterium]|nr:AraC family transcriptional regulator ligand-binding domain-containing protein [Deltaproteobacteria bacterium]